MYNLTMSARGVFHMQVQPAHPVPWLLEAREAIAACGPQSWNQARILENFTRSYATFRQSENALKEDVKDYKGINAESVFFQKHFSGPTYGDLATRILKKWEGQEAPSLPCILYKAAQKFGFKDEHIRVAMVAGMLGMEDAGHEYHNASHNRKVVLQAVRLATEADLSSGDTAKLLIAAAIHDLGHDGKGNIIDGTHVPFRLEKQSFECARLYLEAARLSSEDTEDIKYIVLATDVSPLGNPNASAHLIATGQWDKLPEELSGLKERPDLQKLARMIAVADIASSAALSREIGAFENELISKELGKGSTASGYEFFSDAVSAEFQLPEAASVYGDNPKRIRKEMRAYLESSALSNPTAGGARATDPAFP